jgi:hypothetical protein
LFPLGHGRETARRQGPLGPDGVGDPDGDPLGEQDAVGELVGEPLGEPLPVGLGDRLPVGLGDRLPVGLGDVDGLVDGLTVPVGEVLGEVLGDGEQVSNGWPAGEAGWVAPARPARPTTATGTATSGSQISARDRFRATLNDVRTTISPSYSTHRVIEPVPLVIITKHPELVRHHGVLGRPRWVALIFVT